MYCTQLGVGGCDHDCGACEPEQGPPPRHRQRVRELHKGRGQLLAASVQISCWDQLCLGSAVERSSRGHLPEVSCKSQLLVIENFTKAGSDVDISCSEAAVGISCA
jgi:hypothetical protein